MFAASVGAHILTTPPCACLDSYDFYDKKLAVKISLGTGDSGRSREVEYEGDPLGGEPTHHPCCRARFTMGPSNIWWYPHCFPFRIGLLILLGDDPSSNSAASATKTSNSGLERALVVKHQVR